MSVRGLIVATLLLPLLGIAADNPATATEDESLESRVARLEREARDVSAGRGAKLYAGSCAVCHGRDGKGDGPAAAELDPKPRDLSWYRRFRFRTTATGQAPLAVDVEQTIRNGLPSTSMPPFGDLFSDREISELIDYIDSIQDPQLDEPPLVVEFSAIQPPDEAALADGRSLYILLGCAACHGLQGDGQGPSAPFQKDDDERPIRTTDLRYDPFKAGNTPESVVRTMMTGLNGVPMPSYEETMMVTSDFVPDLSVLEDRLTEDDRSDLDSFIRSSPSAEALGQMQPAERKELRDRRMAAVAHYVLSLSRRKGFWFRLTREQPELEPRKP